MNTTNLEWRNGLSESDRTMKLREAMLKTAAMWAERWQRNAIQQTTL